MCYVGFPSIIPFVSLSIRYSRRPTLPLRRLLGTLNGCSMYEYLSNQPPNDLSRSRFSISNSVFWNVLSASGVVLPVTRCSQKVCSTENAKQATKLVISRSFLRFRDMTTYLLKFHTVWNRYLLSNHNSISTSVLPYHRGTDRNYRIVLLIFASWFFVLFYKPIGANLNYLFIYFTNKYKIIFFTSSVSLNVPYTCLYSAHVGPFLWYTDKASQRAITTVTKIHTYL